MNVAVLLDRTTERFAATELITYVSLVEPDRGYRADALQEQAIRFAGALRRLGVEPGDRVAVMAPNTPEITALYSGILRSGAVILPILFLLAEAEVERVLKDAEPKVIVTSGEFHRKVQRAATGVPLVRHLICLDPPAPQGMLDFSELLAAEADTSPILDRAEDEPALLLYTGGTTGRAKGVMLTHGNLAHAAEAAARVSIEENGVSPDDVTCSALPLAHAYGFLVWLLGVRTGMRTVLMRWFEPGAWLRCVEEHRCTTSPMVPAMIGYLLEHPDVERRDTSSLRFVSSGAAQLPPPLGEAFERAFGCPVLQGWGLTESSGLGTLSRLSRQRPGSVGLPAPGVEISLRDPFRGEQVKGPGQLGELCMRGDHIMAGYWDLPEDTDRVLRGGWLRTGDVGYVDDDGFVFVVDRVDDLILRGGLNIYPRDVEAVLQTHPAVREAAIVGVPDPEVGEEVRGFVVLEPAKDASETELLEHCRGRLPEDKCPKSIAFLDSLPRSGVGKVLRRELRTAPQAR